MFSIGSRTRRSTPRVKPFQVVVSILLVLVATNVAACGGSGTQGQPSIARATEAEPSGTRATTPSRTGELIVFERVVPGSEDHDLYAVEPGGGEPRLLQSPGNYPHWSADGGELAFSACLNPPECTTGVALLDRSTGAVHGFDMPDPDLFTSCAIWAPSGKELACEGLSESDPTRNGVYTVRTSDGKGLTRVTSNPAGDDIPLAYSPDGSQLLLDRTEPSRTGSANHALFITPITGGPARRITPWGLTDDYASWSPDGRTIVFESNGSLYRVSPDGRELATIPLQIADRTPAAAFDVAFSPDGTMIAFSLTSPAQGIYTAHLDGTHVKRLTTSPTEDHHANWGAASSS